VLIAALTLLLPSTALLLFFRGRSRRGSLIPLAGTLALGALSYVPTALAERWLIRWTFDGDRSGGLDLARLVFAFLLIAPLGQALKVAAAAPAFRSRHYRAPLDAMRYAALAALGFVSARSALELAALAPSWLAVARTTLAAVAHPLIAAWWGYALGRDARVRLGGTAFSVAWLLATLATGVFDHLALARGPGALVPAMAIVLTAASASWLQRRSLTANGQADGGRSARASRPVPSLRAMREALRRTERPVLFVWMGLGGLVTLGVITAALAAAVFMGHRLGLDFAAAENAEASAEAMGPLVLLGGSALAAFPIAGYLVARASATGTVLEPAMGAGLAIAVMLILFGLVAPVALVFALAFAPIAFGLACLGAWVGLAR
jgi:hypothetical protein